MPDSLRDFITVPEESLIPLVPERAMENMLADALYRDGWRERMCGRKRRYSSLREAREFAKVVRKHTGGRRMNSYECPFCHYFHVGNKRS